KGGRGESGAARPWLGVQSLVELHSVAGSGERLDSARERVAAEEQAGRARELTRLHRAGSRGQQVAHLRTGGHVESCLDDGVVADRDADAGVRPQQGTLADDDAFGAPT